MKLYKCRVCGYIYDPEIGEEEYEIAHGTPFEIISNDYHCPICNSKKKEFFELTPLPKETENGKTMV